MRLRSPLRQISPKTAQWRSHRLRQYGLLSLRCRGICEGCGQPANLDPHHIIGREEEPLASSVELLAGLCRTCHRAVTGEVGNGINFALRRKIAAHALDRLNKKYGLRAETLNEAVRVLKKTMKESAGDLGTTR